MKIPTLRMSFMLLLLPLVFAVLCAGPAKGQAANDNSDKAFANVLSENISKQWRCKGEGNVQIELKFRLTREGDVYHLDLSKGFEDPYAIRAALHAVLFAMPLPCSLTHPEKSLVICTISGDKKAPTVDIRLTQCETKNLADELLKVPNVEKYSRQTFIYGPMALRLRGLCECLYDFPSSPEILSEIQKVGSGVGLNINSAHDWVGIARWGDRNVVIMRNPSQETQRELRGSLAAYLEAWRLKHDRGILYELEDAWTRLASMEVLAASRAYPLLLGNAALLTNQFKTAKEQYDFAIREGQTEVRAILAELKGQVIESDLQGFELRDRFLPKRNSTAWESLLYWIPLDTETVLFETKFSKSSGNKAGVISLFGDLTMADTPKEQVRSMGLDDEQLKINSLFSAVPQVFCLHAARTFKVPKGAFIGVGFSDSVDIIVLPEDSKQLSQKVLNELRQKCDSREALEGIEVLGFEKTPWSFGLTAFGTKKFVCAPIDGVLVASTDLGYLREMLSRLRTQPGDRALPSVNPEWKFVDTTATVWAVRHYDQAYVPFDNVGMYDIVTARLANERTTQASPTDVGKEIGFTFHCRDSTIAIHQISSNSKTLEGLAKVWPGVFNYDGMSDPRSTPVNKDNPKVFVNNDVLSVEGTAPGKQSLIPLQLFMSLGYFVAI